MTHSLLTPRDPNTHSFGIGDASYLAAGKEEGIRQLVNDFYDIMATRHDAQAIHAMHSQANDIVRDKLTTFLCGWLGGPRRYAEKYGPIQIPRAHQHLAIGEAERDAWLACMQEALNKQPYDDAFKDYLLAQLRIPAERCRTR